MTGAQLKALIRRKTRASDSAYTDANMLIDVNLGIEELAGRIQAVRPEIWNIPALDDLVADQREYAFASDTINSIVSLELKFTSTGDYVPAIALKSNPAEHALQESVITSVYSNSVPYFFTRRKAFYVLSGTIENVTDGIKLVYNAFPAALADLAGSSDLSVDPSTTTHGFPREFHELLATRTSIIYKQMNSIDLDRKELQYDEDLEKALDQFSEANADMQEVASMPSSASLSNHGYDL